MGNWKTYLIMYFGSGKKSVSEIVKEVETLGFSAALGPADFVYDWKEKVPTKSDVFGLADKLKKMLDGTGVVFNIDTHN